MKGGNQPRAHSQGHAKPNIPFTYEIPEYKEPINNPMIPSTQKTIYRERQAEKPRFQKKPEQPVLNLQLYSQRPKPRPKPQAYPHPAVFYPNYVPNPFNPVEFANYTNMARFGVPGGALGGPIFKEYNINIGGVGGSHTKTSLLFEDALPIKDVRGSYATIAERKMLHDYIRSTLFNEGDGKNVPIDNENNNLLSRIKFMEMNPYNDSRFFSNPYRGLPYGFLLYRSCYPIRHNERNATSICARNSTGVNVRIYRMVEGAYLVNRDHQEVELYDLWRDIQFYEYVSDQIVKKKICPNFAMMYGYHITLDSRIDFETVATIDRRAKDVKEVTRPKTQPPVEVNPAGTASRMTYERMRTENRSRENKGQIFTMPVRPGEPGYIYDPTQGEVSKALGLQRKVADVMAYGLIDPKAPDYKKAEGMTVQETAAKVKEEMNSYRGKVLVCLTEASNYSLMGWAKKEYRTKGNVKSMTNYGYHPPHVWHSILFQLMAAMYVMQIKGIVIRNFKLGRNVFIKDIYPHSKATNYWKYIIDGVEYFVPNYGFILLIDSNYRDFDSDVDCTDEANPDRERKIDGNMVKTKMSPLEITDHVFESFKSVIDPNVFDQTFKNDRGVEPPEEIIQLISNIKRDADSGEERYIGEYIRKNMTMFLHNRVGTLLKIDEEPKIARTAKKEFRDGEIVVMPDEESKERFVIHVRTSDDDISRIITKDRLDEQANIIEKDVPRTSLLKYSTVPTDAPEQTFSKDGVALNTKPIEVYTISRF